MIAIKNRLDAMLEKIGAGPIEKHWIYTSPQQKDDVYGVVSRLLVMYNTCGR